jgi:hypothetical protein
MREIHLQNKALRAMSGAQQKNHAVRGLIQNAGI